MEVQICFICLKRVKEKKEAGEESENYSDLDLKQVFHKFARDYLEITNVEVDTVFGTSSCGGDERAPCFCEDCEVVLSSICGLYLELLGIRLRLSWKVEELGKLLESSKTSVSSKLEHLLINSLAKQLDTSRKVVDGTRSLLITTCAQKGMANLTKGVLSCETTLQGWRREIIKVEKEEDDDDGDNNEAVTDLYSSHAFTVEDVKMEVESSEGEEDRDEEPPNEAKAEEDQFFNDFHEDELEQESDSLKETKVDPAPVRKRGRTPAAQLPQKKPTGKKRGPKPKPKTEKKLAPLQKEKLELEGWICSLCKEPAATDLTKHISCHQASTINKGIPCTFCWRSFDKPQTLESHIVQRHKTVVSDGPYSCDGEGCPLTFHSLEELNTHSKTHHESLRFCKSCGLGCLSVNHLKLHKIRHIRPLKLLTTKSDVRKRKGSQLLFPCSKCDLVFSKFLLLHDHFCEFHCSGVVPSFKCATCGKSARTKQLHRCGNGRGKTRPEKLCCSDCPSEFKNWYGLHAHRRDFHNPINCSRCGETVAGLAAKRQHDAGGDLTCIVLHHCPTCGNGYTTATNLANHIRIVHTDERFNCTECSKIFKCRRRLKTHISVVHSLAEKSHSCLHCNKCFASRTYLVNHLATVHRKESGGERRHKCPTCEESFGRRYNLESHILKCDPVKAAELLICCKICGRPIKSGQCKWMMNKHVVTHMSAKEREEFGKLGEVHLCATCGKEFKSKQSMERHALAHEPVKGFLCEQCPKTFHSEFNLKNHVRNVHSGVKTPRKKRTCKTRIIC